MLAAYPPHASQCLLMCESFSLFARQPSGYATEGSNHRGLVDPRLEVCYSHTRWSLALDSLTLIILTLALAPALTLAQALTLALPQP